MKKVFFGPSTGIWRWAYADIEHSTEVEYAALCDRFYKMSSHILTSSRIIGHLPLFLQKIIWTHALKYNFFKDFQKKDPILFFFSEGFDLFSDYRRLFPFLDFLKRNYPNSHFAMHRGEAVNQVSKTLIPGLDKRFDVMLTYNLYDAKAYGWEYYYSVCESGFMKPKGDVEECDIFYAGGVSNKMGRFELLLSLFKVLPLRGIKCLFIMTGLTDEQKKIVIKSADRALEDGAEFKGSKFMFNYCGYNRYLAYMDRAKAVLEIMCPVGHSSSSLRGPQALQWKRKLITNIPTILDEPFFHPENILYFEKPDDITRQWLETPMVDDDYDFSPMNMIKKVEARFE